MRLPFLSQDALQEILKQITLEDIISLSLVCKALRSIISEDRHLWVFILNRDSGYKLSNLPANAVSIEAAPVSVLRAWVKHAYILWKAYQCPSLRREIIRIDTPARVTFVKIVRGRWLFVASSDTTISELSVWEVISPSSCKLRNRVYFRAPVLDGVVEDGRTYIRLAISVGTCIPSIYVLELARGRDSNIALYQCAIIPDASRVLYLKDSILFFACLHGDDTWPTMLNWKNGALVRLNYSASPSAFEYTSGLHVWKSYILLFTHSGLHIFNIPEQAPTCCAKWSPIISLPLPRPAFKVTFLDEYSESINARGFILNHTRWVSQLGDSESAIMVLTHREIEISKPLFAINLILNPLISDDPEDLNYCFALDVATGSAGGHIVSISADARSFTKTPLYKIAPIRSPLAQSKSITDDETHLSVTDPVIIPGDGLPSSRSVSCLDFDDGHGILLIGSDAGQFCLVNFAKAFLPDDTVCSELPTTATPVPLELDIPAYFSYRSHPEYEREECPEFVVEDALRLWGNAFSHHPPIPGWTSDWSRFSLVKEWFLPPPLWSTHESIYRSEMVGYRIRNRLRSTGEIIPILFNVNNHARVILRVGERVLYCRTILPEEDFADDDDVAQAEVLGILPLTFAEFASADSDTILAHINNREPQRNLEVRNTHTSIFRKERSAIVLVYAMKEAINMGKNPDVKTFDEWNDGDWEALDKRSKDAAQAKVGIHPM